MFLSLPDHEQHRAHEPNLMPKETIPNVVKVVNLVPVVPFLQLFLALSLDYLSREDRALEIDGIGYVDLAEVDEVMSADEVLDSLAHEFDVEVVLGEEVLVAAGGAPVASVEVWAYLLAPDYADVFGEDGVHHVRVVHA